MVSSPGCNKGGQAGHYSAGLLEAHIVPSSMARGVRLQPTRGTPVASAFCRGTD